jgi:hypothetical protein
MNASDKAGVIREGSAPCPNLLGDLDLAEDPYGCVNPFELIYPLFQGYRHCVAYIFADHLSKVCPYGKLVVPIAQGHKRTSKGMPIDFAPNSY